MVKFTNPKGWDFISSSDKNKIILALDEIKNPQSDRTSILDFLFDMYNLHFGGSYRRGAQTCPTCVRTVINTFNKKLNNGK